MHHNTYGSCGDNACGRAAIIRKKGRVYGRTAAQLTDANRAEFNISKGVYIIRIGNRSFKVMVR